MELEAGGDLDDLVPGEATANQPATAQKL